MASVFGITQQDLVNFSSADVVNACFDDGNDGVPVMNTVAMGAVIDRGEQEVLSWLVAELGPAPFDPTVLAQLAADSFLKYAAIEYIIMHMYDRHPEYVRAGMKDRIQRKKDADERMQRILDARQRPPTVATPPANVGGVGMSSDHTLYVDQPGDPFSFGRHNGDY